MRATRWLDDPVRLPDDKVEALESAFLKAMANVYLIFGENSFRKWPLGATGRSPINRALFETWSIAAAPYDAQDLVQRRDDIVERPASA